MSKQLCKDWSGYTLMDGLGKVTVQIRRGYLSTGYKTVTDDLPAFIRCYDETGSDGKTKRVWVCGVSETPIPKLDGMYPNAVVQHYRLLAREARAENTAGAPLPETPATGESSTNPLTRSASQYGMSARA